MNTLFIDIETSPNLADVWDLYNGFVSINQLRESSRMLCFAAYPDYDNDHGNYDIPYQMTGKGMQFWSEWEDGHRGMVEAAFWLVNNADEIVHYNGVKFDERHLNREFEEHLQRKPSPFLHTDLMRVTKKNFALPSYKLQYVAEWLGVGKKMKNEGHGLWVKVLAGDEKAQAEMRRYCMRDTALLRPIRKRLLPWMVTGAPNMALLSGSFVCTHCGSPRLRKEGFSYTATGQYQRYSCGSCHGWSTNSRRTAGTTIRTA